MRFVKGSEGCAKDRTNGYSRQLHLAVLRGGWLTLHQIEAAYGCEAVKTCWCDDERVSWWLLTAADEPNTTVPTSLTVMSAPGTNIEA